MHVTTHPLAYLQTGDLTPGNRLEDPDCHAIQASPFRPNSVAPGHRACRGCGLLLAARVVMDAALAATNGKIIAVNATGCLEVVTTPYPQSAWGVPWMHSLFGNAPAVAAGIAASMRALHKEDIRVIAQGGDGATVDIGFGCLSGMFDRDDDVLYVCYDNEAYMNTGVQRSGATPRGARTATTQAVGPQKGNPPGIGKNLPAIAMAHNVRYVATASVADVRDLESKVTAAMSHRGARYLHVLVPCPVGWGFDSELTVAMARLAVETGLFPLFEALDGEVVTRTPLRHRLKVEEYLKPQKRFAHLFGDKGDPATIAAIQAGADLNITRLGLDTSAATGSTVDAATVSSAAN
jgi:pyruvate ferredoxin oxidoreductase beta subunit